MRRYKCGNLNMHWYQDGDTCVCGQIPQEMFFATSCSCGIGVVRTPVHSPDCAYVAWANKRNYWVAENTTEPELSLMHVRSSEYYRDWNAV